MQGMVNNMEEAKLKTLVQIKAFVDGTSEAVFRVPKEGRNQLSSECSRGLATPLTDGCPSFLDGCARGLKQEDLSAVVPHRATCRQSWCRETKNQRNLGR